MEAKEHQERWPVIGQSDVADVCRGICESIVGRERAFEAGESLEQADIGLLRAGNRSAALRDLWEARRKRSGTPTPSASRCGARTARATAERSRADSSCARGVAHAPRRRFMGGQTGDRVPSKIVLQTRQCQLRWRFERNPSLRSDARCALLAHRIHVCDARSLRCICSESRSECDPPTCERSSRSAANS